MGRRPADIFIRRRAPRWRRIAAIALCMVLAPVTLLADSGEAAFGPFVDLEPRTAHHSENETSAPGAAAPHSSESLPIGPARRTQERGSEAPAGKVSGPSSMRTIGALGVVILLIFLTRWGMRKAANRVGGVSSQLGPGGRAPSGVLTVLARYPVGRGQSLVLLQMDQRVLLLNQTAQGFQTLAEITDPEEVASLLIKTRDEESESLSTRFTGLLKRFERDPEIVDRNEWPSRNPTTVDAAMRLFPGAAPDREEASDDPLAAIRRRVIDLEGTPA